MATRRGVLRPHQDDGGRGSGTPQHCAVRRPTLNAVSPRLDMTQGSPISTLDRIRSKQARVGVIGLGYVGLPLAVEFARAGFEVTGFDVDLAKTAQINAGTSYIPACPER